MQIFRVVMIAVMLVVALPVAAVVFSPAAPVLAANEMSFNATALGTFGYVERTSISSWANALSGDGDSWSTPSSIKIYYETAGTPSWSCKRPTFSFNTTALPVGADILSATLSLRSVYDVESDPDYIDFTIVEGLWYPGNDVSDYQLQYAAITPGSDYLDYSTSWNASGTSIQFNSAGLGWITPGGITSLGLRAQCDIEAWASPADVGYNRIDFDNDYFLLTVQYSSSTDRTDIEIDSNSSYNHTAPGGDITAIDWISLRAAYSDEYLGFRLSGDVNEEFSLSLLSSDGVELSHVSDNIRDDGYYFWKTSVPYDFSGWIKVVESNFGIESTWGRVELPPLESVDAPYIVVGPPRNTSYGGMCDEMLCSGGVGILHWQTQNTADAFEDRSIRWWFEGDSSQQLLNLTQQDLLDNQLGNTIESGNDHMIRHRFVPFSIDLDGGNNRNGLVLDLEQAYSWETSGLYLPVLWDDNSDIQIGDAVSAAWYVCGSCSAEGLNVAIPGFAFESPASIDLSIFAGSDVYMLDRWDNVGIGWYTSAGNLISTHNTTLTTNPLMIPSWVSIIAPGEDYSFRVTFVDSTDTTKWQYIVDLPFTVGGVGGGAGTWDPDDIDASIEELGGIIGIGIDMLKYLILLLAAVILFYVCRRDPTARLVAPGLVLGFGIIFGWLPIWIVVLLAVVVGFIVWKTVVGNNGE